MTFRFGSGKKSFSNSASTEASHAPSHFITDHIMDVSD
ncbi:hypothetical protein RISK_005761 [Rhodopirellula islandica]|uniref:Uncharacterized protein n=1 Tax=Rhodopirellula islandica TaxID=595434 RepID=A0A0J1B796_RHOIS|nr:hypothetical protein RISK_005761 [Rhodopirellula islandica]